MNALAEPVPPGSDGLCVLPFGNGAERMLNNRNPGARLTGIDLNRHDKAHLCRAVQEGIAFAFLYGMEIMENTGFHLKTIRAGVANLFQSELFCRTLADGSGASIELYQTDGALGAARGAGLGAGLYSSPAEAFGTLKKHRVIPPGENRTAEAYAHWKTQLQQAMEPQT
jgi:xylulokinase